MMQGYTYEGAVDCTQLPKVEHLKGKTVIVTGGKILILQPWKEFALRSHIQKGCNGLGEAYVRALVAIGTKFIRCDVTKWEEQVRLFQDAVAFSETGKISHVIANAGIHRPDDVFLYSGDHEEPKEPDLSVIDVNIKGTLYTAKLAAHHFIRQNGAGGLPGQDDTSLVLIGSGAAFLDCPRAPQYSGSKWAMRGIMHSLRRTAFYYGSRVNVISPWYVKTNILSDDDFKHVFSVGVKFAETEDASQCLLRILGDEAVNGHSFFVSGKKRAPNGYLDLDLEDYPNSPLIREIQEDQMKSAPVDLGLFV
ncbi:unnamed protein product [Penicillium salamii]|uniref:Uncharacterized protein n=1 Tax=Penicillium salamii TaxID=1612424 RepID=A0A9W4NGK0_9EURO|nr:unnamed protein product [Penicillium salamii]CAG8312227.1 unnamed protein product [Penicillium salamii]CAG8339157.1 unnamed protein product [Penicillium salamii]CAG8363982.1 unnamed protein product [Penicillium salamii]CAG8373540.1 unnamed protein product [Penicillium salamii]